MTAPAPALELRAIVDAVAADPALWRPLVLHDAEQRRFELLSRDEEVEVWVVSWMPGHDTGFHDHEASAAAIVVAEGAIREQRLAVGRAHVERHVAAGQALTVRPADIHRVLHSGPTPSVTIHAYSPPLRRMGQYESDDDGTLRRHAQDAEEELRPIAA
ncbi:MAG: cysteine dioxygenase family protein [Spirochaetaceae bacterium]|nr:cysteine dioxygenase family protein [Spirochaetaceae bacterium]